MNIRTILTFRFISITAIIILLGSTLIYFFSADYREDDFYNRLANKANNTAKLLIEVDEVDAELLKRIELDNPVSLPNEKIIIYNFEDSVLFSTDEKQMIDVDKDFLDRIRLEDEVRWYQGEFQVLGFLFKGKYDRFVVIAAATDIHGQKKLKNLIVILTVVFAISIVVTSISGWFFSGKALEPIARVIRQVDDITITSLNLRVDEGNGQDEIAKLAKTFNRMLARLETSFKAQKLFISNASHELRTPLTAITGQLEVVLMNERSSHEYKHAVISVLEDIKNLTRLSNQLLLLAQASAEERQQRMSAVRIDELIWQTREDIQKIHPSYVINIDLEQEMDDEKLTTTGDEQLLKASVANLIDNACKYSRDRAVSIFVYSSARELLIDFSDKGIGIPGDEIEKVFEPFYRGSNAGIIKGHGIGLSMVRGIIKLHGGSITIKSSANGTLVTISLPYKN